MAKWRIVRANIAFVAVGEDRALTPFRMTNASAAPAITSSTTKMPNKSFPVVAQPRWLIGETFDTVERGEIRKPVTSADRVASKFIPGGARDLRWISRFIRMRSISSLCHQRSLASLGINFTEKFV